jgi:hypothetical protein
MKVYLCLSTINQCTLGMVREALSPVLGRGGIGNVRHMCFNKLIACLSQIIIHLQNKF